MILEFKCRNFRSIMNEVVFSMLATSDNSNPYSLIDSADRKILKKSIVYGANGSGKSNFIKALAFLKALVLNSHNHMPSARILFQPHRLSPNDPTKFVLHFITRAGNRYAYDVEFNGERVVAESLHSYPNGKATTVFSRSGMEITTPSHKKEFAFVSEQFLKENRLFLSCAAKYSNVPETSEVYAFFAEDLIFYPDNDLLPNNWREYSAGIAQQDPSLREKFVRFIKDLGSPYIKGLNSSLRIEPNSGDSIPPVFSEEIRKQLSRQPVMKVDVSFVYENFQIELENESLGNQKLFEMFFPLIDVLSKGKVFLCDEFERSLHPLVVQKLIDVVSRNSSSAQFILTTHEISLLTPSLFRRDEVWFTEMNGAERSTDLYSLAELKAIRKDEIYSRNYIVGKYSSIPIISSDLENLLLGGDADGD